LIFPHLPPEQDVKLAASAGVTDVTGWPELQDIGLAASLTPIRTSATLASG
jgi:hypothetical protein